MHTCLSLANVDCHSRVEDKVADLADRLNAFCDSIDSCHISVEQPIPESGQRCWRLTLNLRIFDESVRACTYRPAGADPARSLAEAIDATYSAATEQMKRIARRHHCCCAGLAHNAATHSEEYA